MARSKYLIQAVNSTAGRTTPGRALRPEIAGSDATCIGFNDVAGGPPGSPPTCLPLIHLYPSGPLSQALVNPGKEKTFLVFANQKREKWDLVTILTCISFIMTDG